MPGKVNPIIPEMVAQVGYQTIARDLAITLAAQGGQLELNAFLPLMAANILPAMEELTQAMRLFADRCIAGIEARSQPLSRPPGKQCRPDYRPGAADWL